MSQKQKRIVLGCLPFCAAFAFVPKVGAMHIMEGYLTLPWCIAWGALCVPFLLWGFFSIRGKLTADHRLILIFAMAGAYAFTLSALKVPSVTGSSSHMTGTGLGAILFGPAAMSLIGMIVLLFQALLLAHGGITTLGANIFSMAIAGPFVTYGTYFLLNRFRLPKPFTIFFSAFLGSVVSLSVTSFQLGMAYPAAEGGIMASSIQFLGIFAVTQLPLAIIEGMLTVLVVMGLKSYASSELKLLGFLQ